MILPHPGTPSDLTNRQAPNHPPELRVMLIGNLLVALVLAASAAHAAQASHEPDRYAAARDFIRSQLAATSVPSVAVAVFRDGRIDWEEGFGWADREGRVEATPHTMYSLASISKSFTATGLMVLSAEKRIDLDRPVNDYLGDAKLTARIGRAADATVRRVANHTSGLPFHVQFFYYDEPYRRPPMDLTILRYGNIISRPGARYNYSNLGYGILSEVLARQSHESYSNFMRASVFLPLGLTRTSVDIPETLKPFVASRYETNGARLPYYDTDHPGASEVFSSAHDLIRFAAFHLKAHLPHQRPILDDAQLDAMHVASTRVNATDGYGVGFETSTKNGYPVISHGGAMPGVATQMLLVPDKGIAIVVLCNTWASGVVDDIADHIAKAVLPDWKATPEKSGFAPPEKPFVPTAELTGRWVGHIAIPEGELHVVLDLRADGRMSAAIGHEPPTIINAAGLEDGKFTGQLATALETKDTRRYKHTVRLVLRNEGDRLYGGAVALADPKDQHFTAGLTYWFDLSREKTAEISGRGDKW
jgi:CubicO group peptidase (beta-lactamase class C family)